MNTASTNADAVEQVTTAPASTGIRSQTSATLTRLFGWSMLSVLAVWLINNVMTLSYGWPGVPSLIGGEGGLAAIVQLGLYAVGFALVFAYVSRTAGISLRKDAQRISDFNAYLIRWAFFAVMLVGLVDAAISFIRVEGMLEPWFGKEMSQKLGRSAYRGPYVHIPLILVSGLIALRARTLGFHWLTLMIVIAELLIVFTRFIFSYEQAFMGDLVRFWYAALFLFASAYTLLEEGHVRVDVFYAGMQNRTKAFVNAWGSLLLGMTLCWAIIIVSLGGKNAIVYGTVTNFEVSQSGFGMYVKYLMASFLVIFAITMLIQFVSYLLEAVADLREEPGSKLDRAETVH